MSVFKLGVEFTEANSSEVRNILSGKKTVIFVEGNHSIHPDDRFLIVANCDLPAVAIATAGKVNLISMTSEEAKVVGAIFASMTGGRNGIEARIFSEIRISEVEILIMNIEDAVARRYAAGTLRSE